jgi:hypothetical protein
MCTVLLPPGDNPIAVNKYINITYHIKKLLTFRESLFPPESKSARRVLRNASVFTDKESRSAWPTVPEEGGCKLTVTIYCCVWRNIGEELSLRQQHCENLNCYILKTGKVFTTLVAIKGASVTVDCWCYCRWWCYLLALNRKHWTRWVELGETVTIKFLCPETSLHQQQWRWMYGRFIAQLMMVFIHSLLRSAVSRVQTPPKYKEYVFPVCGAKGPNFWVYKSYTITHTQTHTHTHTHIFLDSSERVISPSQRPLPTQHLISKRDKYLCPQWN